jgi:hypothetical protein
VTDILSNRLQLISARTVAFLDAESLDHREAKEALFRDGEGFILYLSDGDMFGGGRATQEQVPPPRASCKERLLSLSTREALLWLNESQTELGSFWG